MADYTDSKGPRGAVWPDNATEAAWGHLEPLITAEQLKARFLFGIPLVSAMRDPITGKAAVMTDDLITDTISRSVALVETEAHFDIFPVQRTEKYPWDKNDYDAFGYFRLNHRPVASVEKLSVTPPNNLSVYEMPLDWIETANLPQGQLNIIPLTIALGKGGYVPVQNPGGAILLNLFTSRTWLPSFWEITYTTGFPDGNLPRIINELIGVVAAMEVLGMLAATYARTSSASLGIDGLSQSVSTPGPQLFEIRIQALELKRQELIGKLKTKFGLKIFSGNV